MGQNTRVAIDANLGDGANTLDVTATSLSSNVRLSLEVEGGKSGRHCFAATENHTIFTPSGEVAAGDLQVGDDVLIRARLKEW